MLGTDLVVLGYDDVADPNPIHGVLNRFGKGTGCAHVVNVDPILVRKRFVGPGVANKKGRDITSREESPHVQEIANGLLLPHGVDREVPPFRAGEADGKDHNSQSANLQSGQSVHGELSKRRFTQCRGLGCTHSEDARK